jgi:hypothetical protein
VLKDDERGAGQVMQRNVAGSIARQPGGYYSWTMLSFDYTVSKTKLIPGRIFPNPFVLLSLYST